MASLYSQTVICCLVFACTVQVLYMNFLTSTGPVFLLGPFVLFSRSVSYTVYVPNMYIHMKES
jgi:hypothetical protein